MNAAPTRRSLPTLLLSPESRASGCRGSPHSTSHFKDPFQLRPLIRLGDLVAVDCAREAALRAQAQTFERHVLGGLVEPSRDIGNRFEPGGLRGEQAEYDDFVF